MGLSEGSSEKIKSYRVCKRFVGNGEGSEFGRELWPKRIFFFFLHLCNFPDRQGPVNKAGHRVEPGSHHTAPGISFGLHSLKCSQQVTSCFILPIATIFFFFTSFQLLSCSHFSVFEDSAPQECLTYQLASSFISSTMFSSMHLAFTFFPNVCNCFNFVFPYQL